MLETVLLGAAYPLGLVRAAEEDGSGRLVVQLTDRGRYVLAMGPTPPPRATFEQFLFVQPNFEVIAYRQGLTPQLAGRLSRFAWWSQIGSALELKLTRESIVLGLDWGLTAEAILDVLTRHSQRALPPGVTDAVKNWASRRERVTYYAAATLIEFGSSSERDLALTFWPTSEFAAPLVVAERFLLVEDEKTVPFDRLRLDQLARLSPAAGDLRAGRARRRDADTRPGSVGPIGGSRARAVRRPSAPAALRAGPGGGARTPAIYRHPGISAPRNQSRDAGSPARRVVLQAYRRRSATRRDGSCSRRRHHASRPSRPPACWSSTCRLSNCWMVWSSIPQPVPCSAGEWAHTPWRSPTKSWHRFRRP